METICDCEPRQSAFWISPPPFTHVSAERLTACEVNTAAIALKVKQECAAKENAKTIRQPTSKAAKKAP